MYKLIESDIGTVILGARWSGVERSRSKSAVANIGFIFLQAGMDDLIDFHYYNGRGSMSMSKNPLSSSSALTLAVVDKGRGSNGLSVGSIMGQNLSNRIDTVSDVAFKLWLLPVLISLWWLLLLWLFLWWLLFEKDTACCNKQACREGEALRLLEQDEDKLLSSSRCSQPLTAAFKYWKPNSPSSSCNFW